MVETRSRRYCSSTVTIYIYGTVHVYATIHIYGTVHKYSIVHGEIVGVSSSKIGTMATKFEVQKFNGSNFSLWKMKMKAILRKDKCLAAIEDRPASITDDNKWNEMNEDAMADLYLGLADEVLSSIEEKKTANEIWDALTKLYEAKSLHNKIFLKRRIYTLRMLESTTVTEHINTLQTLFSQLTSLGHKIEENERAELLLQSLPDSYDQLIINLTTQGTCFNDLVFDDIAAAVLEEENRRKNKEDRLASSH